MAAPVGPKKVHRYTLEFKIQAVKLANHPEIQTQDVAHALDIHPFMLSKWKKDYREGKLKPAAEAAGLSLPKVLRAPKADAEKRTLKRQVKQLEAKVQARREVRTLERKLAALEVEHDLLKKPSASISNAEGEVRVHSRTPGAVRGGVPMPALPGVEERLLRMGEA
jgi:transposase